MVPLFGILIKISSKGPIFFTQKREGYKGTYFKCIKFRTMVLNSESDSLWADDNDKRLTKIGRFLRLTAFDEMPQFFNVLKGDMSIVGPRPHMTDHTKHYSKEVQNFMQRHKCLPGITGWAQVNGLRGPTDTEGAMDKRFQHDLYYIKNWYLMLDIYILIRTVFVVLFQRVD